MVELSTLITYSIIVLGFVFIPGPATLLTIARATTSGRQVGLATGLGIAAGDIVHTVLAIIGISAAIAASANLFTIIKYVGAAYLIYLGIRAFFSTNLPALDQGVLDIRASTAFRQAVIAEVLNPKSAMFFLAFLPQFVQPANGLVSLQLLTLGGVFAILGLFSTALFAVGADRIGLALRRNRQVLKWQGKVVGTIYCALGVRLALQRQ